MMRYLPHTSEDIQEMLDVVGVKNLDDLFGVIPEDARRQKEMHLPVAMSEWELAAHMQEMSGRAGGNWKVFVGAGSQAHHIPAMVSSLAGRSEFVTSYTPYQPEMSQGTLQAIFEFQTLVSRLVGLDVTNASMYDGSTALAESALMAQRITKRNTIVVSEMVHPHWRQVLQTYMAPKPEVTIVTLPTGADGRTDYSKLKDIAEPAVLLVQSTNFLGVYEDIARAAEAIHAAGGLLVASYSEPFALALCKSPGSLGADIVCGEMQSFGLSQGFGGPTLGSLSCKREFMRQIPGRLVGQTKDLEGKRGFVLTLSTREQHIRRGKAVSNICSNAGHCALTASIYMATLGGTGFRKVAQANLDLAEYLKAGLVAAGFQAMTSAPTFNEFALVAPASFKATHERLQQRGILAGTALAPWFPNNPAMQNAWLFGVTETKTRADIDALLKEVCK